MKQHNFVMKLVTSNHEHCLSVYYFLKRVGEKIEDKENFEYDSVFELASWEIVDNNTVLKAPNYMKYAENYYWFMIHETKIIFRSKYKNIRKAYHKCSTAKHGRGYYVLTEDE